MVLLARERSLGKQNAPRRVRTPESFLLGVPFVAQGAVGEGGAAPVAQPGHAGVAPEAQVFIVGGHRDCARGVRPANLAGQLILGQAGPPVGKIAAAAPQSRPFGTRVALAAADVFAPPAFLVAHQGAMALSSPAGDAVFPPGFPVYLVAAEESQVNASVARRRDVGAGRPRPVLVVTDGEKHFVAPEQGPAPVGIHVGGVAHIVAVGFQPANHRVFGVEYPVFGPAAAATAGARHKRPVVAHLGCFAARAGVEAFAVVVVAVHVVGLPRSVGGLKNQLRVAGVVSHNEHHVAGALRIVTRQLGDVYSRYGRAGNSPSGRFVPVAAIQQAGRVGKASSLGLREGGRDGSGSLQAGAVALVITQSVNLDRVRPRIGFDFETGRFALVVTDVSGVTLNT